MPPRRPSFKTQLTGALRAAHAELRRTIGKQRLYGFVLYTSGERDFDYLCVSASTEESLGKDQDLRWSIGDWTYHEFDELDGVALPGGQGEARDRKVYNDMVAALRALDAEGRFGRGKARAAVILNIVCGDMSTEFFVKGLERLNPKPVAAAWIKAHTPGPYLDALEARLPRARRLPALLALWRDLALDRDSAAARAARTHKVTQYAVEPRLAALGAPVIPRLVDLIEEIGFGPPFNPKGSPAWARHGSSTVESSLASSAAFLIPRCGRPDATSLRRLQQLVERKVAADRKAKGIVSTLAENLARTLHQMFPDRFPATRMSGTTNRLLDPAPYLPGPPARPSGASRAAGTARSRR